MHADNSVIAHLIFDLFFFFMCSAFMQCIRYIYHPPKQPDMRVSILVLALPISAECVDMFVIPEEGKGKDGHRH